MMSPHPATIVARYRSSSIAILALIVGSFFTSCSPKPAPSPKTSPSKSPSKSESNSSRQGTELPGPGLRSDSNPSIVRWIDRTTESGVIARYENGSEAKNYSIIETLGGGCGLIDIDRDGWLDLIFSQGGGFQNESLTAQPLACFRNQGGFRFHPIAVPSGLNATRHYTIGVNTGDFDQDGFADLHISGVGGHQLFRNQGDGTFSDSTSISGLTTDGFQSSSAWGDFDGDGWLDLYVAHYALWTMGSDPNCTMPNGQRDVCIPTQYVGAPDELWYSNGDGSFRDARQRVQLPEAMRGMGVATGDWDLDGDCDIYVANDIQPNLFFENQGQGEFRELGVQSGASLGSSNSPDGSMGVGVGDFDNNLLPDFLVTNFDGQYTELYQNQGRCSFRIGTRSAGLMSLGNKMVGWGVTFLDVECDGDEDAFIVAGHPYQSQAAGSPQQKPIFLLNRQRKRLESMGAAAGDVFQRPLAARGLSTGDLDNNGTVDAVVACIGENGLVMENASPAQGRYLTIELVGTQSNRDAIGAWLICKTKSSQHLRCRFSGGSFASSLPNVIHLGLGEIDSIESLEVYWPSGLISHVLPNRLDSHWIIVEQESM